MIVYIHQFLDQSIPLSNHCSHADVKRYPVKNEELKVTNLCSIKLAVRLIQNEIIIQLQCRDQFVAC